MIMDAHIHNIIEPGYSRRLNLTLTKNNIQPLELETPESEKHLDYQIIGETIQAMSEREEKLDRLKTIGKHLGAESDSLDEESDSTEEIPHASVEANELKTKIFASETKVPKRTLNPSSLKVYFMLGHIKYQIADPNISADRLESLIKQEKLYTKNTMQSFFQRQNTKKSEMVIVIDHHQKNNQLRKNPKSNDSYQFINVATYCIKLENP